MKNPELNQLILEKAPYGVFITDNTGRYLQVNPAACHITGYAKSELLQMELNDLLFPEDKQIATAHFTSLQQEGHANSELPFKHKDGSRRYWSVAAEKLSDDRFLAFCFDVTEKVKAQQLHHTAEQKLNEANEEYVALNEELNQTNEELKQTNEELMASLDAVDHERNEKQLILNSISDMVIFHDLNMNVVWTNNSAARAVGADASDIIGKPCYASFGINPGNICDGCPVVVSLKEKRTVNYRKFHRDGKTWDIRAFPAFDIDGKLAGVVETMTDITQMVNADQALKESEERLSLALKAAKQGLYDLNLVTGLATVNDQYALMLEYDPKTFVETNNKWLERMHPNDHQKALKAFHNYVSGITTEYKIEFRQKTRTGKWVWILSSGEIVEYDKKGKPVRMMGTHTDITDKKRTENDLIKSEEKYRLIFERSPLGVIHFDQNGVISECNDKFVDIIGSSKKVLEGLNMLALPDTKVVSVVEKVLKGEMASYEGTYHSVTAQKTTPVRMLFSPVIDQHGKVDGGVGLIEDRSSHVQKEELRQQVEVAKESARFKQNFLANMSHEIRTPLTGVLGMIDILERTSLGAEQREYVNILKNSGESLKEIIDQVLDFSKIEAGRVSMKYDVFAFKNILDTAVQLFAGISNNTVKLTVESDENIPVYISADKNRISQVVNNLISNAVKFTRKGQISLKASLDHKEPKSKKITIKIEVRDTGIGIPKDMLGKLFTPFSQIDENDTRVFEGTGLGLSICKELVNLHGGDIGVQSEHGKGSNFWFTFSAEAISEDAYQKITETKKPEPESKVYRVLFAEDKVVNQKVVGIMLTSLGHEVTIVSNGKEAVSVFDPNRFDLILMDIQMPVMDGITATKLLKSRFEKLPPVVGLSANAFEGDREKYMAGGMDDYLTKPVKREDFNQLLRRLFG
jgi:PAS domain S-box-containing protein